MPTFKLFLLGCVAAYAALLVAAAANPNRKWVYWLFGYSIGPRTDVGNLTKRQLWSSSWRFLCWGVSCFAGLIAIVKLPRLSGWGLGAPIETIALALILFLLMGLGFEGGLYLLVRCLLRPSSYVAPERSIDA